MTSPEFRASLARLHLSQSGFSREIAALSGQPMSLRTVQAWALGGNPVPSTVAALLAVMEREQGGVGER